LLIQHIEIINKNKALLRPILNLDDDLNSSDFESFDDEIGLTKYITSKKDYEKQWASTIPNFEFSNPLSTLRELQRSKLNLQDSIEHAEFMQNMGKIISFMTMLAIFLVF
jgi:hypothetical protein